MHLDSQLLLHSVESIATFFLIGWLGYYLTARGWFDDKASTLLSRLLTTVIIPLNLVYSINTSVTKGEFLPLLPMAALVSVSILATMLISAVLFRVAAVPQSRRGVFLTAFSCSNTINIGLPINLALFGPGAVPAVLLYYMGNTVIFWTVGNYLLVPGENGAERGRILTWQTVKRIFSPPIIAFFIGLGLMLLDVKLPVFVANAAHHVGGMTTGLATLCIGIALHQTGIANIRPDRDVALVSLGRFVISPLVLLLVMYFFSIPDLTRSVFVIQASLPAMSSIVILACRYNTEVEFATMSVSFTTLCALATVPLFMMLVG